MSHLPIQHKNETTPGRAVSRLTVVKSYIGKPNEGQLTDVKMGHVQATIRKLITWAQVRSGTQSGIFHYNADGYVLLTLLIRIFAIVMTVN